MARPGQVNRRARSRDGDNDRDRGGGKSSPLHIGQLLRYSAVADAEHVDAPYVVHTFDLGRRLTPLVTPAHDAPIAGRELLLHDECRPRIRFKESLPKGPDRVCSLVALAIGRWASALEHAV